MDLEGERAVNVVREEIGGRGNDFDDIGTGEQAAELLDFGGYIKVDVEGEEMGGGDEDLDDVTAGEEALQGEELGGDGEEKVVDEDVGGVADDFHDVRPGEHGTELVEFQVDAGGVGVELAGVGEGGEFVELRFRREAFGAPEVGHEG